MSLMRAREAVMKSFVPTLQAHNLSEQQWRVLRVLAEQDQGMEMTALSEYCFLLAPSLSRIIQNLESRLLVQRVTVPEDNRKSCIRLTEEGLQLFESIAPLSEDRYKAITANFGYGKLELLYELLEELINKVDEPPQ